MSAARQRKRRSKNFENAVKFFTVKDSSLLDRARVLTSMPAEEAYRVLKLCREHRDAVEYLEMFAKRFKQTADEMSFDEFKEVYDFLDVKGVLEA